MKSKAHLITSACVAALIFGGPSLAFAASKKKATPAPSPAPAASAMASPAASKAPRAIPFHGNASAVDKKAKTFTIAGKEKSRVFKVTSQTVITKAGAAATMADITENEMVRGSYWKQADGSLEAKSVKVGELTDAEKAAQAKRMEHKKEKKEKMESADTSASPAASPKK